MTDTAARTEHVAPDVVNIVIDGKPVVAKPGELIIEAAARAGVFIPRFCYHPRMKPVGMCRMCLVEVSGPRGLSLQPACFFNVNEGQEIVTTSVKARKAQEGVLEFLLVNHPLDCPVCDKGGECPLQDQTLSHGPGESRFIEEKRHFEKPIAIGPLVNLDRERCIQCARCTRFADEIAGEALIDFAFRGEGVEVATFPGRPFSSYFSGNTVQICPVGALTSTPYRFKARPWDLEQVETTCTVCSVGCRVAAQSSAGSLVRYLGIDSDPINQSWLCDKGRFGFEANRSASRLTEPLVRRAGELVSISWQEALGEFVAGVRQATERGGPEAIGVIGGARLSNEDAYAWAKFVKATLGTDSVDAQLGDGLPADLMAALPRATIDEACNASTVILLGPDLREELPVLYLRLRDAALRKSLQIVECSPVATALSEHALVRLGYLPGEAARLAEALVTAAQPEELVGIDAAALATARGALHGSDPAGSGIVIVLGRPSLAESGTTIADAARRLLAALPGAKVLPVLRRGNVQGALDMGLAPGLLPGRVSLDAGREWFGAAWGGVPAKPGLDTAGILAAAAAGELSMLVLLGADPLADFPDRRLARQALVNVPFLVAIGTHFDASIGVSHLVLPIAGNDERTGTTTNCESRVSRLAQKVVPPGVAWPAWTVAAELSGRLRCDLGFPNFERIAEEIELLASSHRGLREEVLARPEARDGVIVPITLASVAIGGSRGTSKVIDPIATPGIGSVEEQGAPLAVGTGAPLGGDAIEEAAPSPTRPPMLTLGPATTGAPVVAPRLDAYSLRLVLRHTLYDGGTVVEASPSLAVLRPTRRLAVNPHDLANLGVTSGARLRLRSPRGALDLEVLADETIARNVVATEAKLAAPGEPDPAELVDAADLATDVHLETIS